MSAPARRGRSGGRRPSEIVVIRWRDIPAQVNGRRGDERHQVVLPRRFQRSIDEAAMRAGKRTANEYIAEWRRETIAVAPDADLGAAVARLAAELDAALSREALGAFVRTGGFDPATHPEIPAPADLPAAAIDERDEVVAPDGAMGEGDA